MTATKASRPAHCPFVYHDRDNLYLEFEGMVLTFAFTEGGLTRALKHIPDITPFRLPARNASINRVLPKVAAATARKREILNFDQDVNDAAAEILRKMDLGE
jgi:hypothetical protein